MLQQYCFIHEARSSYVLGDAQFPPHARLSLTFHLLLSARYTLFYIILYSRVSSVSDTHHHKGTCLQLQQKYILHIESKPYPDEGFAVYQYAVSS